MITREEKTNALKPPVRQDDLKIHFLHEKESIKLYTALISHGWSVFIEFKNITEPLTNPKNLSR